ncbi:MAG: addiction module toxin RelE [Rhodobacteraceae bacterium]|nr:addiction module toxin RelE [Paracoccaceae bacterium]MYF46327.1 addiction module toxin RelE [Paracoccaceae bacterium]MYG09543.1 addiction module toxin RelE [Paracoccaceae bacterium]MYI91962.1 addiction module toxin RelE [Paracoccaceae bacterium]
MHTVVETPNFSRNVDKVLGDENYHELIDFLAWNPLAGDEIPGTGGVRKIRIAASGRGKRGGARVVYFHGGIAIPVYLLMIYPKSAQEDITPRERQVLKNLAAVLRKKGKEGK